MHFLNVAGSVVQVAFQQFIINGGLQQNADDGQKVVFFLADSEKRPERRI